MSNISIEASFTHASTVANLLKKNASCIMPISVGRSYHEDEKLKATLELVNKKFVSCTIILADTLQRHNLYGQKFPDINEKTAHHKSIVAGDEWLRRNQDYLSILNIPYEILRWDDYLKHANYPNYRERVERYFISHPKFKQAIETSTEEFLIRLEKRQSLTKLEREVLVNKSLEYIKEESAIMPMWAEKKFTFELYPKPRIPALNIAHELFVTPYHNNVLLELSLRFKKKRNRELNSNE